MTQINLTFKENFIESFAIDDEVTIGSSSACGIYIDSLAVQPQHAKLVRCDNEFTITSMGSDAEILINGQKVSSQQLKDGDQIQVGKHTLEFINPPPLAPETPAAEEDVASAMPVMPSRKMEAFLQVLNGNNVGKTITLTRKLTNLGKPGVQTAIIARREEGYFLSHLEGENPPTVNGTSIGDTGYELNSGDSIQIGNVKLLFSIS